MGVLDIGGYRWVDRSGPLRKDAGLRRALKVEERRRGEALAVEVVWTRLEPGNCLRAEIRVSVTAS